MKLNRLFTLALMAVSTLVMSGYQFGMLAEDQCSRQKLVNWSNWVLEVVSDGKE